MTISEQVKKNMEELDNMLFQDEEGGVEHFDIESVDIETMPKNTRLFKSRENDNRKNINELYG